MQTLLSSARAAGITHLYGDVLEENVKMAEFMQRQGFEIDLSRCGPLDAVIHLAGENLASGRWTEARKRRIRQSRVEGTRLGAQKRLGDVGRHPRCLAFREFAFRERGEILGQDAGHAPLELGGQLRMTLLRSAPYAEHDPAKLPDDFARPYLDQGWQERRLWLMAGRGPHVGLGLPRLAEELQSPAEYVMDSGHGGDAPRDASFLEVGPDNVVMLALAAHGKTDLPL